MMDSPPAYDPAWLESYERSGGSAPPPPPPDGAAAGTQNSTASGLTKEQIALGVVPNATPSAPLYNPPGGQYPPGPPPGGQYPPGQPPGGQYPPGPPPGGQYPPGQPPGGQYPPGPPPGGQYPPGPPQGGQYPPGPPPGGQYPPGPPPGGQYPPVGYPPSQPVGEPPGGTYLPPYTSDASYPPPEGATYPPGLYPPVSSGMPLLAPPEAPVPENISVILTDPYDIPDLPTLLTAGQPEVVSQLEPEDTSMCDKDTNCCGIFFSAAGLASFVACIWLLVIQVKAKHCGEEECPYDKTTLICAAVFLVFGWMVYIIEGCCSSTLQYVSNIMNIEETQQYFTDVRNTCPRLQWKAECYHNDTRSKTVTRYRNGHHVQETETETIKVVTHTETKIFHYTTMTDASGSIGQFNRKKVTRVEIDSTYGFRNPAIKERYEQEKRQFREANEQRDEYLDFDENYLLVGIEFKDKISVYVDEESKSACMDEQYFWYSLCCFLTWPYRLWYRSSTECKRFTFVKLIGD